MSSYSGNQKCSSTIDFMAIGVRIVHDLSLGYDHLDGCTGRLHTNIQVLDTFCKNVGTYRIFKVTGHTKTATPTA